MALAQRGLAGGGTIETASHLASPGVDARNGHGSATLAIERGVPVSVAAVALVTFTAAAPRNKNRHCCWYGTSSAGNGYSLCVLLSGEHFANRPRVRHRPGRAAGVTQADAATN